MDRAQLRAALAAEKQAARTTFDRAAADFEKLAQIAGADAVTAGAVRSKGLRPEFETEMLAAVEGGRQAVVAAVEQLSSRAQQEMNKASGRAQLMETVLGAFPEAGAPPDGLPATGSDVSLADVVQVFASAMSSHSRLLTGSAVTGVLEGAQEILDFLIANS